MMRYGMSEEESIEKAFGELMALIAELKAESKVNAARSEAAEGKIEYFRLKAEENCSPSSPGWPIALRDSTIDAIADACFQAVGDQGTTVLMRQVARAIERHHGITKQ